MKGLKLTHMLARYWWVLLAVVILIPAISGAYQEAQQEEDWRIFFIFLGEELVSVDNILFEKINEKQFEFQSGGDIVEKLDKSFNFFMFLMEGLWKFIWIYIFVCVLIFKIFVKLYPDNKVSKNVKAFITTVLIVGVLQIIVSGVPFRGLILFFKTIIQFGISF